MPHIDNKYRDLFGPWTVNYESYIHNFLNALCNQQNISWKLHMCNENVTQRPGYRFNKILMSSLEQLRSLKSTSLLSND